MTTVSSRNSRFFAGARKPALAGAIGGSDLLQWIDVEEKFRLEIRRRIPRNSRTKSRDARFGDEQVFQPLKRFLFYLESVFSYF